MNNLFNAHTSTFILRVSLGTILIAHSLYLKLMVFTLPGTAQFFSSLGLPAVFAYLVFAIEAVSGIALVLGFKSRLFSLLVVPILFGATWVHAGNGWLFTNTGGGWEYPLLLSLVALAQAGLGDGKYAISQYLQQRKTLTQA